MNHAIASIAGALLLSHAALPAVAEADVDLEAGRAIFNESAEPPCAICHSFADAGAEGEIGPNLDTLAGLDVDRIRAAVSGGVGIMPAFDEVLTPEQIETVAVYVDAVAGNGDGSASK